MSDTLKSPWARKEAITPKTDAGEPASKDSLDKHYSIWKSDPTPNNAGPMLEQLQPDIEASLKHYGGKTPDQLRTQANLLALQAMERWDATKGTAKRTHVRNSLHKLTRLRNDRNDIMHIPENVQAEQQHIRKVSTEFEAEYDREPNLQELADLSTFSIRQIERIRKYGGTRTESQATDEKGDLINAGLGGKSEYDMWLDYVYFELDPIDKKVYEWSTGYKGSEKIPKKEIAARLKISAPAVSKRVNKIIAKIEQGQELNA